MLASATALSAQARQTPGAIDDLLSILTVTADYLGTQARSDPDLALALARGLSAFSTLPQWSELGGDERRGYLRAALAAAPAIDEGDGRDAFGCFLAEQLHRDLRAAGDERGASESLERELLRFPSDLTIRPRLLCLVADEQRIAGAWNAAWEDLHRAEDALARVRAGGPRPDLPGLERNLAGVRLQLELHCGLVEQAALSLAREREALKTGADDPESRGGFLLDVAALGFAQIAPVPLQKFLAELDQALADPQAFAERPEYRAQVRARRALLQDRLEAMQPGTATRAARMIAEALADESLDDVHRCVLLLRCVDLALRGGDLAAARDWLARLDPAAGGERERPSELAFGVSAWRARVALARGAERAELEACLAQVEAQYERFLESWAKSPVRAGGLGFLEGRNSKLLLGALVELCIALDGQAGAERALELLLREQSLGTLARRLDAGPGSLAEIRAQLLRQGAGLLVYAPTGPSTAYLWCVDARGTESFAVPWRHELEQAPRALAQELARSPAPMSADERRARRKRMDELADALGSALVPARVQAKLAAWNGAYVVGAEATIGVPFECLRVGGKALGTALASSSLPSLPVGLELARRAQRDTSRPAIDLLLVAAPELGAGLAIPFTAQDAQRLCAGFARTTQLSGSRASWTNLLEALAGEPTRVLHLLVHGAYDPERELAGGLALPGGADRAGRIWCEDVLASRTPFPPLVVLSACGSARGPRRMGDDGLAQLGGALLCNGARCVLQAANDIALAPTIQLLQTFDRELASGKSPAEALRLARVALGQDPELADPFYALSLRVVGLGLEPVFPGARVAGESPR